MKTDRAYFSLLSKIAIPIIIQQFISSSLNMVDVMLIGQLGEVPVAAVGLGNQIFFILFFVLFGISSGSAIFSAQYWGKGDVTSIRKILGLSLILSTFSALIFSIFAFFFPATALGIYTNDPNVISLGTNFLRISSLSYVITAITISFASTHRSTGNVQLPMAASIVAIFLKTSISYVLIFGKLGFAPMGIDGAAIATLIARLIEMLAIVSLTYIRKTPVAAKVSEMLAFNLNYARAFLKTALPVAVNESLWALGISTYNMIYAHIGTSSLAAMNIVSTVENLGFVIFIGISDACAILIGNKIGAGEEETAARYARNSLTITSLGAMLVGGVIYLLATPILSLYRVSPEVILSARRILTIVSCLLWVRVSNMTIIVGILRAGGDTRFGLMLDVGLIWLLGVPSALLGAFVFHLPIHWVYLLVMSEEIGKLIIGIFRFRSKKWINNLAHIT